MLYIKSARPTSVVRSAASRVKCIRYNATASNFQLWRASNTIMATPSKISLAPADVGVLNTGSQTQESASIASELLQRNHENHHILFNKSGFHNHIAHHLLTIYALGASPDTIKRHYERNKAYQRKPQPLDQEVVRDMTDYKKFKGYLGNERYYHDFLIFFQEELEKRGVDEVLKEFVFKGDERADDLLIRLFGGFFHPIIHLGFGLEFNQPAIVAEALAQACIHDNWMGRFLLPAEEAARQTPPEALKTMPELLVAIRNDHKLSSAAQWDDNNKLRDGIIVRAPQEMIHYAAQWRVPAGQVAIKTAEMMNTCVYYTAAAQRPPKQVKFDFYYMHDVNTSIFWSTFNKLPYLTEANKVRLLEWKARSDLAQYAARRSPELHLEEVVTYVPKDLEAGQAEWKGIFKRLVEFDDDGHAVKLGRAVANAEKESEPYEGEEWCIIKSWMWEKVGNMVVDSVQDSGNTWVRSAGFEEAWEDYEDRPRQVHL